MHSITGAIVAACIVNVGMCFIWPVIEALVSEGETPDHIPHAIGIYNMTWAVTNAAAYFVGGAIIEKFGYQSIFYLPFGFMVLQLAMVFWIEKLYPGHVAPAANRDLPPAPQRPTPANAKTFQHMAWLANPFAYIAINTLLAVMPGIAAQFHLSTSLAGFVCSLWCFARVIAFLGLWQWTRWHYRFHWLAGAFGLLILSFVTILSTHNLALLLVAQVFFGLAIGLIYYSSLFYSMDASDTKSEHGGIHEAAIGLGNCAGPLVGAASLQFFPQYAHNGVMAVSVLLLGGFGGLVGIWRSAK
jgi:MFS family permease